MKLRHATALALVGWYLMMPPLLPRLSEGKPYLGFLPLAPLSQWIIVDSFDSMRECIDAHVKLLRDRVMKNVEDEIQIEQAYSARCIATDDPRLKEKQRAAELVRKPLQELSAHRSEQYVSNLAFEMRGFHHHNVKVDTSILTGFTGGDKLRTAQRASIET